MVVGELSRIPGECKYDVRRFYSARSLAYDGGDIW